MKKALIVVDLQYDFCPKGSLAVEDGDKIIPIINKLFPLFDLIIFTKDWHAPDMVSFASQHEGKVPFDEYVNPQGIVDLLWPDHCVEDTPGARLHEDIDFSKIPKDFYIFKKGNDKNFHPYSGFAQTELAEFLREKEVTHTYIVGLATDWCVKDTALDSTKEKFDTTVILDGCKPITKDISGTLEEFAKNNVKTSSSDLILAELK